MIVNLDVTLAVYEAYDENPDIGGFGQYPFYG